MVGEKKFYRMDGLTGTNLQYHLLGDLMVDDDWTTTGESWRGVRPTAQKKIVLLLQLRLGDKPFLRTRKKSACCTSAKAAHSLKCPCIYTDMQEINTPLI